MLNNLFQNKVVITLPWPKRVLFPNARAHWAVRAKEVQRHRHWARLAANNASELFCPGKLHNETVVIHYRIRYTPPTNRRRDEDGVISSCKAYLDGIADALSVNDTRFRITGVQAEKSSRPGSVDLIFWID